MVKRRARISFARRDGWVLAINPQEESISMARLQGKAFATMPQRQGYDEAHARTFAFVTKRTKSFKFDFQK
jgi:hypothetical protein